MPKGRWIPFWTSRIWVFGRFQQAGSWIYGTEPLKGNVEAELDLGALSTSEVTVQGWKKAVTEKGLGQHLEEYSLSRGSVVEEPLLKPHV